MVVGSIGWLSCAICKGSGLKVVHKQGDPVPGTTQNEHVRTVYAGTLYEVCDCHIIRSTVIAASSPVLPQMSI